MAWWDLSEQDLQDVQLLVHLTQSWLCHTYHSTSVFAREGLSLQPRSHKQLITQKWAKVVFCKQAEAGQWIFWHLFLLTSCPACQAMGDPGRPTVFFPWAYVKLWAQERCENWMLCDFIRFVFCSWLPGIPSPGERSPLCRWALSFLLAWDSWEKYLLSLLLDHAWSCFLEDNVE